MYLLPLYSIFTLNVCFSPSYFNPQEVSLVKDYVKELMNAKGIKKIKASDIGIITPYRKQVKTVNVISH